VPPGGPPGRDRLQDENTYLRNQLRALGGAPSIVGHSPSFRRVLDQVRHAAGSDAPVLLVGETGTGKSLLAGRIHELSARGARVMVRVNCASVAVGAFDPESFGIRNSGSAAPTYAGQLALADGSTLLLDEIGSLPLDAQEALIHLLDDSQIQPPGHAAPLKLNLRVIAATRTDLAQRVAEGRFRDDLYARLDVLHVRVSPLRERPEDIPPLVWRFVDEFSEAFGQPIDVIDKQTMAALQRYAWPGNARELRNVVERGMMAARTRRLRIALPGAGTTAIGHQTLAAVDREHIRATLAACGGELRGENGAAARLGLTVRELEARMTRLGLRFRRDRSGGVGSSEGA
jgi:transcriptional regulator with GAF, ATPase, and Fis domain